MLTAAYDAPPSATNKASKAIAFWRMKGRILSTGRVSPYWVLAAPRPGPRLPFCPNAGWLDCALAACAPPLLTGCEPVDEAELDGPYAVDEFGLYELGLYELATKVDVPDGATVVLLPFDGCRRGTRERRRGATGPRRMRAAFREKWREAICSRPLSAAVSLGCESPASRGCGDPVRWPPRMESTTTARITNALAAAPTAIVRAGHRRRRRPTRAGYPSAAARASTGGGGLGVPTTADWSSDDPSPQKSSGAGGAATTSSGPSNCTRSSRGPSHSRGRRTTLSSV